MWRKGNTCTLLVGMQTGTTTTENSTILKNRSIIPNWNLPIDSTWERKKKSLCLTYLPLGLFHGQFVGLFFSFEWAILFRFFVCLVIFVVVFVGRRKFKSNNVETLAVRFALFSGLSGFVTVFIYCCRLPRAEDRSQVCIQCPLMRGHKWPLYNFTCIYSWLCS